jgi:hypothetical protein
MSNLEKIREENNTKPETIRSKAQTNRRMLEDAIDKAFEENGGLSEFVQQMFNEARSGEQWAFQEILNRKFGKVRDKVEIDINVTDLRPNQTETELLDDKFKKPAIEYKVEDEKDV